MEAKVPRFFMVLPPGFEARLRLPPIISWKLGEKKAQKVLLITGKGTSPVTIQKFQDGRLWFTKGWHAFVLKHGLVAGDYITFKYMGSSNLKVTVYSETCCEKFFIDEPKAEVKAETWKKNASPLVESEAEEMPPPPPPPTQHHFHMNDGSNSREGLNGNHLLEASTDQLPFGWRFLKVMFPGFQTQLTLPPLVCEKLNGEKSPIATLVTAKGSWDVEIENGDQGNLCFGKGWDAFVRNHGLRVGDFAVFEYIGGICFNVSLLDKNSNEKEMDSVRPGEEDDQKLDSTKPNPIDKESFELSAVKVKRDEDIITSQLNSRLAPLLQILAEMDNDDFTSCDGEKGPPPNTTPSGNSVNRELIPFQVDDVKPISQIKPQNNDIKSGSTKRKREDGAKKVDVKRKRAPKVNTSSPEQNPQFSSIMKSYHLRRRSPFMHIPAVFCVANNLYQNARLTLRGPIVEQEVSLRVCNGGNTKYAVITNGWREFIAGNKLRKGDTCIFKLQCAGTSSAGALWDVEVVPA